MCFPPFLSISHCFFVLHFALLFGLPVVQAPELLEPLARACSWGMEEDVKDRCPVLGPLLELVNSATQQMEQKEHQLCTQCCIWKLRLGTGAWVRNVVCVSTYSCMDMWTGKLLLLHLCTTWATWMDKYRPVAQSFLAHATLFHIPS